MSRRAYHVQPPVPLWWDNAPPAPTPQPPDQAPGHDPGFGPSCATSSAAPDTELGATAATDTDADVDEAPRSPGSSPSGYLTDRAGQGGQGGEDSNGGWHGSREIEATRLATCFALDYLSWDEERPERRERVLRDYAPDTGGAVGAVAGWVGRGRQRATFAVPGLITCDHRGDAPPLWVTVHVLVTPYEPEPGARREAPASGARADELASRPSAAPAPEAPGWRALDSEWIRLSVPVRRLRSGRLVIGAAHDGDGTDETDADSSDSEGV